MADLVSTSTPIFISFPFSIHPKDVAKEYVAAEHFSPKEYGYLSVQISLVLNHRGLRLRETTLLKAAQSITCQ
jgi:hypothetical protein